MIKISLDQLEPGMRLAKAVLAANGMVLLSAGTELVTSLIERLQSINLEALYIEGKSPQIVSKEVVLEQLEQRFRNVQSEPYMDLLKKVVQKHLEELYE